MVLAGSAQCSTQSPCCAPCACVHGCTNTCTRRRRLRIGQRKQPTPAEAGDDHAPSCAAVCSRISYWRLPKMQPASAASGLKGWGRTRSGPGVPAIGMALYAIPARLACGGPLTGNLCRHEGVRRRVRHGRVETRQGRAEAMAFVTRAETGNRNRGFGIREVGRVGTGRRDIALPAPRGVLMLACLDAVGEFVCNWDSCPGQICGKTSTLR